MFTIYLCKIIKKFEYINITSNKIKITCLLTETSL